MRSLHYFLCFFIAWSLYSAPRYCQADDKVPQAEKKQEAKPAEPKLAETKPAGRKPNIVFFLADDK